MPTCWCLYLYLKHARVRGDCFVRPARGGSLYAVCSVKVYLVKEILVWARLPARIKLLTNQQLSHSGCNISLARCHQPSEFTVFAYQPTTNMSSFAWNSNLRPPPQTETYTLHLCVKIANWKAWHISRTGKQQHVIALLAIVQKR